MKINTLIIDDEKEIRNDIKLILKSHPTINIIGECGSVKDSEAFIQKNKPDLVLLDIQLSDGTGFELLNKFKTIDFDVIFITAYNQYGIKALKIGAIDYILKPIDEDELFDAIKKINKTKDKLKIKYQVEVAKENFDSADISPQRLILKTHQEFKLVETKNIVYCKGDKGYTTFYFSDNTKIMMSKTLKEYEEVLQEPKFLRIHQSFLINSNWIDKYDKDGSIVLKNKNTVPVSTRKKDYVINFLKKLR